MSDHEDRISRILHDALDGHVAADAKEPIKQRAAAVRRFKLIRNTALPAAAFAAAAAISVAFLAGNTRPTQHVVITGHQPHPTATTPPPVPTTTTSIPPLPGTRVPIPQLVGMSVATVRKTVSAAGIIADIISETITDSSPPGTVTAETPPAGTVGTAVSLTIAVPPAAPCTASQLGITYLGAGAAAGMDNATIALRDTSPTWCDLTGPVTVIGLNASGQAITNRISAPIEHPLVLSPDTPPPPHGQPPPVGTVYAEIGISAPYQNLPTGRCTSEQVIPAQWQIALPLGATATVANHDASALPFPGLVTCRGQLGPANPVQLASG